MVRRKSGLRSHPKNIISPLGTNFEKEYRVFIQEVLTSEKEDLYDFLPMLVLFTSGIEQEKWILRVLDLARQNRFTGKAGTLFWKVVTMVKTPFLLLNFLSSLDPSELASLLDTSQEEKKGHRYTLMAVLFEIEKQDPTRAKNLLQRIIQIRNRQDLLDSMEDSTWSFEKTVKEVIIPNFCRKWIEREAS